MPSLSYPEVSRRTGVPLREQVRILLSTQIETGALRPGDRLPTEAQLASQFGVSLAPVRSALGDLADAGLITRQAGVGTFVNDPTITISIDLLPSLTDTLRTAAVPFTTTVIARTATVAPSSVNELLQIPEGIETVGLRRFATIGGHRSVVLDSWFPLPRFAKMLEDAALDEPQRSLYGYLAAEFGIRLKAGAGQLFVTPCGNDLLPLLDVQFGAPIVNFETLGTDDAGVVAEVTHVHYDASRFIFNINQTGAARSL